MHLQEVDEFLRFLITLFILIAWQTDGRWHNIFCMCEESLSKLIATFVALAL